METIATYGKLTDKTAGTANKASGLDHKLSSGQTVGDFEKSLFKQSPGERVATIKTVVNSFVKENGWTKDNQLSKMNGKDVYR